MVSTGYKLVISIGLIKECVIDTACYSDCGVGFFLPSSLYPHTNPLKWLKILSWNLILYIRIESLKSNQLTDRTVQRVLKSHVLCPWTQRAYIFQTFSYERKDKCTDLGSEIAGNTWSVGTAWSPVGCRVGLGGVERSMAQGMITIVGWEW